MTASQRCTTRTLYCRDVRDATQDSADGPSLLEVRPGEVPNAGRAPAVWPIIVVALVTVALIVGVAGWLLRQQEETNRRELEDALAATHLNTVSALSSW